MAVKRDDDPVLECLDPKRSRDGRRQFFRRASDVLRILFQTNSWELIKNKGYYGGLVLDYELHTDDCPYP